jgi:hypothetical protein
MLLSIGEHPAVEKTAMAAERNKAVIDLSDMIYAERY